MQRLQEGAECGDLWILHDQAPLLEPPEPAQDRVRPTGPVHRNRNTAEQQGRPISVAGELGVHDGGQDLTVRFEPHRCPVVQAAHDLGFGPLEFSPQHLAQEVVAAVPVPLAIERNDQHVRVLERLEQLPASPWTPSLRRRVARSTDRGSRCEPRD